MVKAFYQSTHYEPIINREVAPQRPGPSARLSGDMHNIKRRVLDYFERRTVQRLGVLHGEYLLHPAGTLLFDRQGLITAACVGLENALVMPWLSETVNQFDAECYSWLHEGRWDDYEIAEGVPIFCDPYERNYYHFSLELTPRARFFPKLCSQPFIATPTSQSKAFQVDLWGRCFPGAYCHYLGPGVRVRDPIIAHDEMNEEGVLWLRDASKLRARAGDRRVYLRRSGQVARAARGGGVSETPEFLKYLADNGFEWVECGVGDLSVAEQLARLDGAGVIIATHGAALSNLAYFEGPLRVVEILGSATARGMYMHLCVMLGFDYTGLMTGYYHDENGDVMVDVGALDAALRPLL